MSGIRTRWAAIGAAVAVTLGAGGLGVVNAVQTSGERGAFISIEPCRLVDTRPAFNVGDRAAPLGRDETFQLQGTGDNGECTGIPNDAIALALNVTPVGPTRPTNIRLFPERPVPNASSLNPAPGQPPTPNAVTVDLAGDGSFQVYNFQGQVHLVADIVGYYRHHNHDDRYYTQEQSNDRYPQKAQTTVIPANAFQATEPEVVTVNGNGGTRGVYVIEYNVVLAPPPVLRAPLTLPAGSTVTQVTFHYVDNHDNQDLNFALVENALDDTDQTSIAAVTTADSSPDYRSSVVDPVDHAIAPDKSYALRVSSSVWSQVDDDLIVKGVTVGYTLP